ncbi:MAG TPA: hypothetical protein PLZ45_07360 [Ferruginibacter sp.]|nr:hypothetical protein [Ferruginibacter sp.]
MKGILYTAALVSISALVSCGGSSKEDYVDKDLQKAADAIRDSKKKDTVPSAPAVPVSVPGATQPVNLGTNVMPTASSGAQPVTINTQPAAQQATAAGMNPPHGQPGHRCDIPVGAPLNSKPPAPAQSTTISTAPAASATAQATAPGMNPPHGQPGHRCDIPVGSPLNSKPAQAPAPAQITATPAVTIPAKSDSSKNE